jgi:phytoene dehydrogenase-like protein
MALSSYLASSWRLECTGAAVADALAALVKESGGDILTGRRADAVCVEHGAVTGVAVSASAESAMDPDLDRAESGVGAPLRAARSGEPPARTHGEEFLPANVVVAAIHPKALLGLLPSGAVRPSYAQRIGSLEDTSGALGLHWSVPAGSSPEIPYNVLAWRPPCEDEEIRFFQLRASPDPGLNVLSAVCASRERDWAPWLQTRTGRRGSAYQERKAARAEELLGEARAVLGPLPGARVLDVYTPLTLRDWVGSPGGTAYGVLRSARQRFRAALLNRTPIQGLYCAGQSVLAPGILGTVVGSIETAGLIAGPGRVAALLGLDYGRNA